MEDFEATGEQSKHSALSDHQTALSFPFCVLFFFLNPDLNSPPGSAPRDQTEYGSNAIQI
jgi:hypothetical protein